MADPSWRQLAAIPECHTKARVLHALGITPPLEGISRYLDLGNGLTMEAGEAGLIVTDRKSGSRYMNPQDALRTFLLHKGTPSGDLTRSWFATHNLLSTRGTH
jgi:hypothetical protein